MSVFIDVVPGHTSVAAIDDALEPVDRSVITLETRIQASRLTEYVLRWFDSPWFAQLCMPVSRVARMSALLEWNSIADP